MKKNSWEGINRTTDPHKWADSPTRIEDISSNPKAFQKAINKAINSVFDLYNCLIPPPINRMNIKLTVLKNRQKYIQYISKISKTHNNITKIMKTINNNGVYINFKNYYTLHLILLLDNSNLVTCKLISLKTGKNFTYKLNNYPKELSIRNLHSLFNFIGRLPPPKMIKTLKRSNTNPEW